MTILQERGYFWYWNEPILEGEQMPRSAVFGELKIEDNGRIDVEFDEPLLSKDTPKNTPISITAGRNYELQEKGICGYLKYNRQHVFLYGLMGDGLFMRRFLIRNCFLGKKPFSCTDETLNFKKLIVDLKGYEEWLRFLPLQYKDSDEEVSITYKKPDDAKYCLENGTLTIEFFANYSISTDASLKQTACLTYQAKESLGLETIRDKFRLIEDLFILLTNCEYRMEWPTLTLAANDTDYKYYFGRTKNSAEPPSGFDCWTNFILLRKEFGRLFSTWESKREILGPGFFLYLATRRGMPSYVESRFLDLMMGLESFHRRKNPDALDSEAADMRQQILSQIKDDTLHKWLEEELRYAHEPTARRRLTETLRSIPLKLKKSRISTFANECNQDRNDIVHANGRQLEKNSESFLADLDKKSDALTCLHHLLLLYEIGIDTEILNNLAERIVEIKNSLTAVGLLDENILQPQPLSLGNAIR